MLVLVSEWQVWTINQDKKVIFRFRYWHTEIYFFLITGIRYGTKTIILKIEIRKYF